MKAKARVGRFEQYHICNFYYYFKVLNFFKFRVLEVNMTKRFWVGMMTMSEQETMLGQVSSEFEGGFGMYNEVEVSSGREMFMSASC